MKHNFKEYSLSFYDTINQLLGDSTSNLSVLALFSDIKNDSRNTKPINEKRELIK